MSGFRYEERKSNIINCDDIMRSTNDENFEKLIVEFKKLKKDEIISAGKNNLLNFIVDFRTAFGDGVDSFADWLMDFTDVVINLSCIGLKKISEEKKNAILSIFSPLGENIISVLKDSPKIFKVNNFSADKYDCLIEILMFCDYPYNSKYPFTIYSIIIACSIVVDISEESLNKLRNIRNDYLKKLEEK